MTPLSAADAKRLYAVRLRAYVAHLGACDLGCPGRLCRRGELLLRDADDAGCQLDAARSAERAAVGVA